MGAAHGQFLELELDRLGDSLHESSALTRQCKDRLAAFVGQLDESAGNRLVRFTTANAISPCTQPSAPLPQRPQRQRSSLCAEYSSLCPEYLDCPATFSGQPDESA
jgi:hypothetical protein